jgi:hypothetical protein
MARQFSNQATLSAVNFPLAGESIRTFAGLPVRSALVYTLLFSLVFLFYSVVWVNAPIMESDSETYMTAAQELTNFRINRLQRRPPGYPLLLVLTSSSQSPNRTLFFVSLSLHFASIWLLAAVLYRAGLREVMLTLFGLVLLLPPYVEPAAYVLSENLTEAMLVAGLVGFVFWILDGKISWLIISTLTTGYAALTRPTYQLLAFAIAAYLATGNFLFHSTLKWKDVIKGSLILLCGSIVMAGAYAFVNYRKVGYFAVSRPVLGLALTQKTLRVLEQLPDEYAVVRETLIKSRNAKLVTENQHNGYDYIMDAVPELTKITGLQNAQLSNYLLQLNLLLIQKAPLNYVQEVVRAFGSYWFPAAGELANFNSRVIQFLWAMIHFFLIGGFAFNLILLIGATYYMSSSAQLRISNQLRMTEMRSIRFEGLIYGLAGTTVFYSAFVTCLIQEGIPRYRVPIDAFIVFMLFLGTHLWRGLVNLSRSLFVPQGE